METLFARKYSYELIKPKLSHLQQEVYKIIDFADRPIPASEIAKEMYRLGITNSSHRTKAAPRCTELDKDFGAIVPVGSKICADTGRPEATYITTAKHLDNLNKVNTQMPVQMSLFAGGRGYSG